MTELLQRFYAVTVSPGSILVYEASVKKDAGRVRKVAKWGSPLHDLSELRGGPFVGLTDCVCLFFAPPGSLPLPEDNYCNWGDKTFPLAALFLGHDDAFCCLRLQDLQPLDLRFSSETRRVLQAISPSHPVFRIGRVPLLPEPQIALPLEVGGAECGGILER